MINLTTENLGNVEFVTGTRYTENSSNDTSFIIDTDTKEIEYIDSRTAQILEFFLTQSIEKNKERDVATECVKEALDEIYPEVKELVKFDRT